MVLVKRAWTQQNGFGREYVKNEVCVYWLKGKCNRNPCRFIHGDIPAPGNLHPKTKQGPVHSKQPRNNTNRSLVYRRSPDDKKVSASQKPPASEKINVREETPIVVEDHVPDPVKVHALEEKPLAQKASVIVQEDSPKQCKYWVTGNCVHGDKCKDLHSWSHGSGFQMLAKLEGHSKAVTGLALLSGSDVLYTGSLDNSIRFWDCKSGQCARTVSTNVEVRCLVAEGPWLFVGVQNCVQAWNAQTQLEFSLSAHASVICSMDVDDDKLFAGMEDGSIYVWKWNTESIAPDPVAILKEHSGAVCSVIVAGSGRLYSGSKDSTIKAWNRQSLQCVETLSGHTGGVTSLLCWDRYLLSAALDKTIKVWAATENQTVEVVYEKQEHDGVLALRGIHDSESKPVLLCSCSDHTVRLYDLPSFAERGRIFTNGEVRTIHTDNATRLFFTGDATGHVSVWNIL